MFDMPKLPRICQKCGLEKDAYRDFRGVKRARGNYTFHSYCNSCVDERPYSRSEKFREHFRKKKNCNNHNITISEYERMYSEQDGACAICKRKRKLYIDHDHETGFVRALLCNRCNVLLGSIDDNLETAKEIVRFLELHQSYHLKIQGDNDD